VGNEKSVDIVEKFHQLWLCSGSLAVKSKPIIHLNQLKSDSRPQQWNHFGQKGVEMYPLEGDSTDAVNLASPINHTCRFWTPGESWNILRKPV